MNGDTSVIAAVATPLATGGISVIRVSGKGADAVADRVFRAVSGRKLTTMKGYRAAFGHFYAGDRRLDEGVALVFRAPKSYTGEDVVELSCHGGAYVTGQVLRAVLDAGARPAEPGEFTKCAFLNGRIDLSEAEAVMNVISAGGSRALNAAQQTLEGHLSKKIAGIREGLVTLSAGIAVWTDDPDEDRPEVHPDRLIPALRDAHSQLNALIADYDNGAAVREGVSAVICGRPNVGKSTLMNLLSGSERSIVTDLPGTTRDVVEETVRLGDVVLRLSDTAGLRSADNEVERIGIDMARRRMERSELLLAVFDLSQAPQDADLTLLEQCKTKKSIIILNKSDLPEDPAWSKVRTGSVPVCRISARDGASRRLLSETVSALFCGAREEDGGYLLASERQRSCCAQAAAAIERALTALQTGVTLDAVNVEIDAAVDALLTLTGERVSDTVVSDVFSKFCVGK